MILDFVSAATILLTGLTLSLLVPFALHRLHLLRMVWQGRCRGVENAAASAEGGLPHVTVQLPIYNEPAVVDRLLDAVVRLDYPGDRIDIQVLDDSDDGTSARVADRVEALRSGGVRIEHLHREVREGFKAGALEAGRRRARGEFLLILDADFVPRSDLVHRLLGPFADAGVGMVQARWSHLNEEESLLTRCQALLLDGHFFLEQGGRHAGGRFMSFNGTAGMWRREALVAAGGWSSSTLTEDLDASYRSQMAGWRFVFLPGVDVPAELPSTVRALEVQQQRWAQGGVQTARKLLGRLWRGDWPLGTRVEGTIHLLGHLAHPLTVALGLLLLPSAMARRHLGLDGWLVADLVVFSCATLSFLVFFTAAGRMGGRPWRRVIPRALATMVLGVGLTAPVARSVVRGLRGGDRDPFLRTPKTGSTGAGGRPATGECPGASARPEARWNPRPLSASEGARRRDQRLKGALASTMIVAAGLAAVLGYWGTLPLLLLFGSGWGWLAWAGRDPQTEPFRIRWTPVPVSASPPSSRR